MTLFKEFGAEFLEINLVTLQQDLPSLEMKNERSDLMSFDASSFFITQQGKKKTN